MHEVANAGALSDQEITYSFNIKIPERRLEHELSSRGYYITELNVRRLGEFIVETLKESVKEYLEGEFNEGGVVAEGDTIWDFAFTEIGHELEGEENEDA